MCMCLSTWRVWYVCCTSDLLPLPAQEEQGMWLSILLCKFYACLMYMNPGSAISGCCWRQCPVCRIPCSNLHKWPLLCCVWAYTSQECILSLAAGQAWKQESSSHVHQPRVERPKSVGTPAWTSPYEKEEILSPWVHWRPWVQKGLWETPEDSLFGSVFLDASSLEMAAARKVWDCKSTRYRWAFSINFEPECLDHYNILEERRRKKK